MMKLPVIVVALASSACAVSAFVPNQQASSMAKETALYVERRNVLSWGVAAATSATLMGPLPAFAERPTYLTEPTDEFKESERQRAEFRRAQLVIKQKMQGVLDQLSGEPNDEGAIVKDLNDLRNIVIETGGMPAGIKKDDLVKQVRAKKAKGFWPTNCEIAYQGLISEINFQQSPNKDKDLGNPL